MKKIEGSKSGELKFNEETHTYFVGERIVPSVTQIIGAVLQPSYRFATAWHMARGKALHSAIELDSCDTLDMTSLDEAIAGRFKAYQNFLEDSKADIFTSEVRLYSARYNFAGTFDAILSYRIGKKGICDWKSTASAAADLQIAAYRILAIENKWLDMDDDYHCAVQLNDDGSYRTRYVQDIKKAERVFLAMLTAYNFMAANGMLKGEK
jgi:hypothetical protein